MASQVRLLGHAEIELGTARHPLPHDKRGALLAVLAAEGRWISRERLAFLFWPDSPGDQAFSNLRQLLVRLTRSTLALDLEREGTQLRWAPPCDVVAFRHALRDEDWASAITLYRGPLLDGFALDDASEFTAWLELERRELEDGYRRAVTRQAERYERASQPERALTSWMALLQYDPLDEGGLQQILRLAAHAGRQSEAKAIYERFAARLREAFDLDPQPTTRALLEELHRAPSSPRPRRYAPPSSTAPYVGRDPELTDLLTLLSDPDCRLLTLMGMGGIGKSALALQLARSAETQFLDGVVVVPLVAVRAAARVPDAVAGALSLDDRADTDSVSRILDLLEDRQLLLLLDNLEHLPGIASFVATVLEQCPGVKIVTTSRAPIGLRTEYLYRLEGLSRPDEAAPMPLESYDAVRLFVLRARQVQPAFVLEETDRDAVVAICRNVAGSPLGLELAAAWTRILSCREIADALGANLDMLQGELHDLPERHRSLRAVFDSSWDLLSSSERMCLRRLSVFRGGFGRDAAAAVADAGPGILLGLLDRSLIERKADGRFDLHELVRSYAAEKLAGHPEDERDTRARHADFYAALVEEEGRQLRGGARQRVALARVGSELDNIRAALRWSSESRDAVVVAKMLPLWHVYEIRGLYHEGEEIFGRAAEALDEPSRGRAGALLAHAIMAGRLGMIERSQRSAERSRDMYAALEIEEALVPLHLGVLEIMKGDLEEAVALHHDALRVGERTGDSWCRAAATGNLGALAMQRGDDETAEILLERGLRLYRQIEDGWGAALILSNLCALALRRGDLARARGHAELGLEIARGLGQRYTIASLLLELGRIADREDRCHEAKAHLLEGLSMARDLGLAPQREVALCLLGRHASGSGDHAQAFAYHAEALASAVHRDAESDALDGVVRMAEVLRAAGDHHAALDLLIFVRERSAPSGARTADDDESAGACAQRLYRELAAAVTEDVVRGAATRSAALDYPGIVRFLAHHRLSLMTGDTR